MEPLSKNKIKWISSLRQKKNREQEQVFIVEGDKMVNEILEQWGDQIVIVCATQGSQSQHPSCFLVDDRDMKKMSSLKTAPSILAVVKMPKPTSLKSELVLAIDGVQDPGNMGTILRTADWFGVDKIICSKETVDIFNPKVIQSSMGSLFRMPVEYGSLEELIPAYGLPIYGALLDGQDIYESSLPQNSIIVVGNEGNGISDSIRSLVEFPVLIPQFGKAESLNVAIATGVLLSEFKRSASH